MPVPVVSVPAWTSRSSWTRPRPGRRTARARPPVPGGRDPAPGRAARCGQRDVQAGPRARPSAHHRAVGRPLEHLAATEPDPLNDGSAFTALARIGAQAVVMRIETETASAGTG